MIRITAIVTIGVSLRVLPAMKGPLQLAATFIAGSKSLCISPAFSQAFRAQPPSVPTGATFPALAGEAAKTQAAIRQVLANPVILSGCVGCFALTFFAFGLSFSGLWDVLKPPRSAASKRACACFSL